MHRAITITTDPLEIQTTIEIFQLIRFLFCSFEIILNVWRNIVRIKEKKKTKITSEDGMR